MADFRRPNINAPTTEGQLNQVKSYLYQLTNQLNFALKAAEDEEKKRGYSSAVANKNGTQADSEKNTAQDTFLNLKNLIIKSADIVNAYYEVISTKLEGEYEALSDYGNFKQSTTATLAANSTSLDQHYSSIQTITGKLGELYELRKDDCYIKTGWLDDNQSIAGVEIGKVSAKNDVTDAAFARFTTEELVFYDGHGTEDKNRLGWFAQYKLNIREAKIEGNLEVGGYVMDTRNGLAFKWVGDS